MDYTDKDCIKKKIKDYIEENLSPKRQSHTFAVAEEAKKLALHYGEDPEKAEIAALFHDIFRSQPQTVLNMYIRHLDLPKKIMVNPNLSHGKIAAAVMKKDYGIDDEDILNAVAYHTTGRAGMSKLEKIIFLADAIEPGRSYPTVDEARALAYVDLNKACISSLERTIEYVQGKGDYLDHDTVSARDDLKERFNL